MTAPVDSRLPVNVFETDQEVVVVAPMPGIEPEDVTVRLDGPVLYLASGTRGEDIVKRYLFREWSYGPYQRSIDLAVPVDARVANVTFGNGILTIVLPKAADYVSATLDVPHTGPGRGAREGHSGGGKSGIRPPHAHR